MEYNILILINIIHVYIIRDVNLYFIVNGLQAIIYEGKYQVISRTGDLKCGAPL